MHLQIAHETIYRYASPVRRSTQYLRLTPSDGPTQRVLAWDLSLPAPARQCLDAYGNLMHVLTLDEPHLEIHLHARGVVETHDGPPEPESTPKAGTQALAPEVFLRDSALTQADAALRAFAQAHARAVADDAWQGLLGLMQALGEHMPYTPGETDAATPAAQAFAARLGVCQDHAQVFATCARLLGLPTRYVSGYLAADQTHVASHAWAETWLPAHKGRAAGWLGFDVSNQCLADGRYVRLAQGTDYLDACPVRGMRLGGGLEALHAVVRVSVAHTVPDQ